MFSTKTTAAECTDSRRSQLWAHQSACREFPQLFVSRTSILLTPSNPRFKRPHCPRPTAPGRVINSFSSQWPYVTFLLHWAFALFESRAVANTDRITDLQRYLSASLPVLDRTVAIVCLKSNRGLSIVFRTFIRRNAVFLTTIFASAFAFELCVTSTIPVRVIAESLTKV